MASAVRDNIIVDLLARLADVDGVTQVVEAGEGDFRVTAAADKYAIEVVVGEDQGDEGEPSSSIERMNFMVGLVAYLPGGLTTAAERRAAGHYICAEMYKAYAGGAEERSPLEDCRDAQVEVFCSGVSMTGNGWAVCQVLRVRYAFTRGDPTAAR